MAGLSFPITLCCLELGHDPDMIFKIRVTELPDFFDLKSLIAPYLEVAPGRPHGIELYRADVPNGDYAAKLRDVYAKIQAGSLSRLSDPVGIRSLLTEVHNYAIHLIVRNPGK